MWHLTACRISVSLLFLNWIKSEMIFNHISELLLATLIQKCQILCSRKNKKIIIINKKKNIISLSSAESTHSMVSLNYMFPNIDGMAYSADPDQTALLLKEQFDLGLHYLLRPVYPNILSVNMTLFILCVYFSHC